MNNRVKMVAASIAAALLLAGGAIAAVTATGRSTTHARAGQRQRAGRDLKTAGAYLGVPVSQLQSELRSGSSLAQIAQATPGHSVEGLVSALVSAKRARLAKAANVLPALVRAEVQRIGGPSLVGPFAAAAIGHRRARFGALADVGLAAASYIGIPAPELRAQLASGKTLAEIAREHNRPEAGLVSVIVDARRRALDAAVRAGAITHARETKALGRLEQRVHRLVNHSFG